MRWARSRLVYEGVVDTFDDQVFNLYVHLKSPKHISAQFFLWPFIEILLWTQSRFFTSLRELKNNSFMVNWADSFRQLGLDLQEILLIKHVTLW